MSSLEVPQILSKLYSDSNTWIESSANDFPNHSLSLSLSLTRKHSSAPQLFTSCILPRLIIIFTDRKHTTFDLKVFSSEILGNFNRIRSLY